MDSLLASLAPLKKKKRTTYQKVTSTIDKDDQSPPSVLGTGFLFDDLSLNKIKARLNGSNPLDENVSGDENHERDNDIPSSQTQLISNLYDGGQDLEQSTRKELPEDIYQKTQLIDDPETQIIGGSNILRTQETQEIQVTQATQVISTQAVISEADEIIPLVGVTQEKTQAICPSLQTQFIEDDPHIENDDLNQIATINYTQKINKYLSEDFKETLEPEVENRDTNLRRDETKTQIDNSMSISQTQSDYTQIDQTGRDVPKNLKIHEIQEDLKEQKILEEKKKMIEYKQPKKQNITRLKFSKEDFLAEFDNSEDDELDNTKEKKAKSHIKVHNTNVDDLNSTLDEQFDNEKAHQREETKDRMNKNIEIVGLKNYETELRKEINLDKFINLDDDNDDLPSTNNHNSHASKATLLNIKVRLSKNVNGKTLATQTKPTLNKLFNSLMQANRKQILDHRKELIESKGLKVEDIEKEKEIVENLLEQEIIRNKKIRLREKEREKRKEEEDKIDFDFSDNELEESDIYENQETFDEEQKEEQLNNKEDSIESMPITGYSEIDQEGEGEDLIIGKPRNSKGNHIIDDSESEDESEFELSDNINDREDSSKIDTNHSQSPSRNAIDLGHYGGNLTSVEKESDSYIGTLKEQDEITNELDAKARIRLIKNEKKKMLDHEKKVQQKREELKKKGVTNFIEEEAEESDDEWFGIGGADGEGEDGYDSEVEKMIDDYSKANFNPDEIREMLMNEKKEMDMKLVEKILYDLKNGGLRKRGRSNYDLELSDDEDDDLRQYRIKRRDLMKQRRLDLGDDKLIHNPKSKAFFESMVEDIADTKNPFGDLETMHTQSSATDIPTQEVEQAPKQTEDDNVDIETGSKDLTKRFTLSEDFVHRTLSFLTDSNKDIEELENDRKLARIQHGKDIEDLVTLKKQSSIKSFKSISRPSFNLVDLESSNSVTESIADENDTDFSQVRFRHPSILKLFGSKTDINDKFKEGNKTVKTSHSYRTVGSSKASITYLGKTRKLVAPKKKNRTFLIGGERHSKLNQLFNNHDDSFE